MSNSGFASTWRAMKHDATLFDSYGIVACSILQETKYFQFEHILDALWKVVVIPIVLGITNNFLERANAHIDITQFATPQTVILLGKLLQFDEGVFGLLHGTVITGKARLTGRRMFPYLESIVVILFATVDRGF